ncbi:helix-turn-helix domain-containing protein [Paenibacillus sp. OAS669]|uniref:helix-turn-helix domain-containing protein n=1 Tax=Paenibacillus sp. OAS669 TaxID=2663821 RepID=UPI0021F28CF2|nr:helix-turn-helix domain-containing protein [Paenibacillus sp. OAS669]
MTDKKKLDKAVKLHESGEFTIAQIEEMTGVSKGSLYRELKRRKQSITNTVEAVRESLTF